jgi:hypothetical protein
MMKDALFMEIRGHRDSQEEDLCSFPCSFSFHVWTTKHLVESDGASRLCLCCTSLFDLLGSTTRAEARKGNEPSHISRLRWHPLSNEPSHISRLWRHPLSGKNFQAELNIGAFEDDLLMDIRTGWIYECTVEIMITRLESGPTPCRVLTQNKWYTSTNRVKM